MPQPFLGNSLQSLPLTEIACPSRGRLAPLRLSTNVLERHPTNLVTARFLDARAHTRLPDSPDDYELPLGCPKTPFPVTLSSHDEARSVPPASPASKPSSSRESVRADQGCPVTAVDPLLGFCLSRAFSVHASDSQTRPDHEGLSILPRPKARKHDGKDLATLLAR